MTAAIVHQSAGDNLPLVTLVTPSYNARPYLGAAIRSVLDQDYPKIEYLVMDGGSTDGTVELLREFGDRVSWVSERDDGQADAIARGFARTSGAILGWLNADDVLKPGAVRTAVAALQAHPGAALVYGQADFIDAEGSTIGPCTVVEPYSRQRLLHYGDYIVQPAAFFTRAAYAAVGGLDASLHWAMDWDLWIRLARQYDVVCMEDELASYRWLGSNKTAGGGHARLKEIEAVARRYGCNGLPAYFRLERARLCAGEAGAALRQGRLLAGCGRLGQAAAAIFSSWRATRCLVDPHIWRNYRTASLLHRHTATARGDGQ
ncbi:MAG: glycosyltransferase [Desulfuromonas sp.]|nr:glycosyltransferase [Desulfuromonas sp.]